MFLITRQRIIQNPLKICYNEYISNQKLGEHYRHYYHQHHHHQQQQQQQQQQRKKQQLKEKQFRSYHHHHHHRNSNIILLNSRECNRDDKKVLEASRCEFKRNQNKLFCFVGINTFRHYGNFFDRLREKAEEAAKKYEEDQKKGEEVVGSKYQTIGKLTKGLRDNRSKLEFEAQSTGLRQIFQLAKTDEKPFTASVEIIPRHESVIFPTSASPNGPLHGVTNLLGQEVDMIQSMKKYRATLVTISFVSYASKLSTEWIGPFESDFINKKKSVNWFNIYIYEGMFLGFWKNMIQRNLNSGIEENEKAHHLTLFKSNVLPMRQQLNMTNSKTCNVYLCDSDARVRWTASGKPSPQELETMKFITGQLLTSQV